MKRKYKYLLSVLLAIVSVILLYLCEPPLDFQYANTLKDCSGRASFMYGVLEFDTSASDYLFVGSSKTMNGVNDSVLGVNGCKALNLGYCRYGHNLELHFLNRFLERRKTKHVVLEVREEDNDHDHPISPFLLDAEELITTHNYRHLSGSSMFYERCLRNVKYIRASLFGRKRQLIGSAQKFGYWPNLTNSSNNQLNAFIEQERQKYLSDVRSQHLSSHRLSQLQTLQGLATKKGFTITFLYLPAIGNFGRRPQGKNEYEKFGHVLMPPDSIVAEPRYFADKNHLNATGAVALSKWLAKALR